MALLLCRVLGIFGVHRFYLGLPHAVLMLVTTLISIPLCLIFIGVLGVRAMWIRAIVDLFQVSRYARTYNTWLRAKIHSGQG